MPVWLTWKLIGYAAGAVLGLSVLAWAYTGVKNHLIGIDNLHVELSNERDRANRAEVSLAAERLVTSLREEQAEKLAQVRKEAQERIDTIRDEAQEQKDVLMDRARLERVTVAKPKLVEKLANRATERVFDDLEVIYNSN